MSSICIFSYGFSSKCLKLFNYVTTSIVINNKFNPLSWYTKTYNDILSLSCAVLCLVTQSCLTLCDPMDCSPPGSSIYEIFQATILEWVPMSFSRGFSQPRDRIWVSCIAGRLFTVWATKEAHCRRALLPSKPRILAWVAYSFSGDLPDWGIKGCLGLVHWDDPEGWYREGGGKEVQDGEHVYAVVDSCWCMAKPIQYYTVINLQWK